MLVNFKTETINLNELKRHEKSILLVEGDIIVPDINPDIGKILVADAKASVLSKGWQNGKINITGCTFVNILYSPETEDENMPKLKAINTKLDFADSFSCDTENPHLAASATVLSVSYTLINSRKVNVKITVELCTKVYANEELSLATDVLQPAGFEMKKKPICIHSTAVDCQKEFVFTEKIEVPQAKCDIEEILKTSVSITKGECRGTDGKIALRGSVNVLTLYSGFEEGFIHECMEHELPFFETLDVEGLFDECMCNVTYDVLNVSSKVVQDINGDPREIELVVTICASITTSKIYEVDVLDDLYCPKKDCKIERQLKTLKKNVNEGTSRMSFKNNMVLSEGSVISSVFGVSTNPVIREYEILKDKLILKGDITAFVVYLTADGKLNSASCEFPFEHAIDIDTVADGCICEYDVSSIGTNFNILTESEIEVRTNVEFFIRMTENFEAEMIFSCDVCELSDENTNAPQLVIYFVQKGDTLWDIAKHYNTTVKKIKDANHLEEIAKPGEKILIPAR